MTSVTRAATATRARQQRSSAPLLSTASPEMEKAAVGAMLLDADALRDVLEAAPAEAFTLAPCRLVYEAAAELVRSGLGVNLVTVTHAMQRAGTLAEAGGQGVLANLTSTVASPAEAKRYASIVVERWMMRRLIESCHLAISKAHEPAADAFAMISETSRDLALLDESVAARESGLLPVGSSVDAYLELLAAGAPPAITTGLRALDKLVGGHRRGRLYTYAGRPAMGKSGLALGFAKRSARAGFLSAVFSLEMPLEEVMDRLICLDARISAQDVARLPGLSREAQEQIYAAADLLRDLPLHIDDTPALSIDDLHTRMWRLSARAARDGRQLGVVVVDYLQLMRGRRQAGQSRQEEIASITRALKGFAKEFDCAVVALSQVPRAVEQRPDKRPTMSDLAEGSSIESDSDVVCFVYRDEYYGREYDNDDRPTKGIAELIVAKQRGGRTGTKRVAFIGEQTRFADLAHPDDDRAAAPF